MKKFLITILFMLAAIGAYGQNKFKYPVNANGGLRVGGDNHDLIDSVKIVTGTITIYIGGVGYSASVDTTSLSDRINLKLNISDTSDMLDPYIREAEVSSTYSNKALSNLASVAINTHLLPATDGAVNLGSATYRWGNIFMDSAKVINWNNGDITATHSDQTLTFAGGSLVIPDITGPTNITELSVGNSASNTKVSLDSLGLVDSKIAHYIGSDTTDVYITAGGRQELNAVVIMLVDTVNGSSNNDYVYSKYQIDTMTFAGGLDADDVAAQINDTIVARLAVAVDGVRLADSVNYPNGYMSRFDGVTGLASKLSTSDTSDMLAPYFTESEIRKADSDTIPLFIFGGGGGQSGDTAVFSTSSIYGSFYNEGSDTLVITSLRVIMLGDATDTLSVDILWDVNLDDGTPTELNTDPFPVNSFTTGDEDTSFDGNNIPPGYWVWCETPGVVTGRKPRYFIAQISGFKRNRSY